MELGLSLHMAPLRHGVFLQLILCVAWRVKTFIQNKRWGKSLFNWPSLFTLTRGKKENVDKQKCHVKKPCEHFFICFLMILILWFLWTSSKVLSNDLKTKQEKWGFLKNVNGVGGAGSSHAFVLPSTTNDLTQSHLSYWFYYQQLPFCPFRSS